MLISKDHFIAKLLKEPRVLIIGCESLTSLGIMRCLGRENVLSLGIAITETPTLSCYSRYSKVILLPELGKNVLDILTIAGSDDKGVIFCATDASVIFVEQNANVLKRCWHFFENRSSNLLKLMDKDRMAKLARRAGFHIPKTVSIHSHQLNESVMAQIPFPCIVKPSDSLLAGKEVYKICTSRSEVIEAARNALERCPRIVIQEYIGYDNNGTILEVFAYRRKMQRNRYDICTISKKRIYPNGVGSSSFIKTDKLEYVFQPIYRFMEISGFSGPMDFELILYNQKVYFIEVNYRCGTPISLSQRAEINIPYLAYLDSIGRNTANITKTEFKFGKYWMRESDDWKHVRENRISLRRFIVDVLKTDEFLIFSKDDLRPFIILIYSKLRKFLIKYRL